MIPAVVPDVSLHTALSSELVLHQVGVVGGGDEVMAQRLAHVLEDAPLLWVKDGVLSGAKVHQEAVKCHGIQQLGWKYRRIRSKSLLLSNLRFNYIQHKYARTHVSQIQDIFHCPYTCVRRFIALNELLGMLLDVTLIQLLFPQEVLQVSLR